MKRENRLNIKIVINNNTMDKGYYLFALKNGLISLLHLCKNINTIVYFIYQEISAILIIQPSGIFVIGLPLVLVSFNDTSNSDLTVL